MYKPMKKVYNMFCAIQNKTYSYFGSSAMLPSSAE